MGVISDADKKILLERLAKAREAKAAKKKATSAPSAPSTPTSAEAPPSAPPSAPVVSAAAPDELPLSLVPPVPDLVAVSAKKPKQKKVKLPESSSDSDSEDESVLPPKKKGSKRSGAPYMKIKIYKDSPHALEHILHTIQGATEAEQAPSVPLDEPSEPIPISARRTVCMTGSRPSSNTQVLRTGSLRDAALAFFS